MASVKSQYGVDSRYKCTTCWGYGLWAIGDACPMGGMDAKDGMPTQECPECGANPNPVPSEDSKVDTN